MDIEQGGSSTVRYHANILNRVLEIPETLATLQTLERPDTKPIRFIKTLREKKR